MILLKYLFAVQNSSSLFPGRLPQDPPPLPPPLHLPTRWRDVIIGRAAAVPTRSGRRGHPGRAAGRRGRILRQTPLSVCSPRVKRPRAGGAPQGHVARVHGHAQQAGVLAKVLEGERVIMGWHPYFLPLQGWKFEAAQCTWLKIAVLKTT